MRVLAWLQAGAALIPRSRRPEQITANKHVFAPAAARALGGDAMARWAAIDAKAETVDFSAAALKAAPQLGSIVATFG